MANPNLSPDPEIASETTETNESFDSILAHYEQDKRAAAPKEGRKQLEGTVVAVTADSVYLDIGYKIEGVLSRSAFDGEVKRGDKFPVSIKGRNPEGYYELSRSRVELPADWPALQRAFDEKATIMGTVTAVVKGGLSVDVGVRAFMPASRSGTRDASELEKMVGQEIRCRIIKLDVADEDVVVDRRAVEEEEEHAAMRRRYAELKEGDTVQGTVRSITDYGAFVDVGGVDALLHVGDISWSRIAKPSDVLTAGQQVEARVLKVDSEKGRISIGTKQLQPQPWETAGEQFKTGERVRGTVTRVADFGAFVELTPGVEGLIHVSEMSWGKKVRKASDILKPGDTVEAVILSVNTEERRIALGLKQALGDPWAEAATKFPVGSQVEGPVTSITNFGAFVQLAEGVEGMVHVGNITAERRLNHPKDMLRVGQVVQAKVLEFDRERRRISLGMKQLVPTGLDEYLVEHKAGDVVTGRVMEISDGRARVELGEGIEASSALPSGGSAKEETNAQGKADLSALSSMLNARWKGKTAAPATKPEAIAAGQIRSFRITKIDTAAKKIELELV